MLANYTGPNLLYTPAFEKRGVPFNFMDLSPHTQFEIARQKLLIESTTNVGDLQRIALKLLNAWATQRAATAWVMRQSLGDPPKVTPESLNREAKNG